MKIFEITEAASPAQQQVDQMLAKIDTVLQSAGIKRDGFKLVKDTQSGVRGSITPEALAMVKATLVKAETIANQNGIEPSPDPKSIINPADVPDSAFTETATAGSTSSGSMATVANPASANAKIKRDKNGVPMAPQKKNADGTAKNALELGNNLMGGATVKR